MQVTEDLQFVMKQTAFNSEMQAQTVTLRLQLDPASQPSRCQDQAHTVSRSVASVHHGQRILLLQQLGE